ncbi:MAG: tetratricopeptide repeat protein [Terracidiphilus sp.]|jgi:tetratricopeptide (TPR) repeat protein
MARLRIVFTPIFLLLFLSGLAAQISASPATDDDRKHALKLYDQNKFTEALPLLEKLAVELPQDLVIQERLASTVFVTSGGIEDPEQRKQQRLRARALLLHAREMGDNSNLLQVLLDAIPPDGSESSFSPDTKVEQVMRKAESAFESGDLGMAVEGYTQALVLDPKLYLAALYGGDTLFKMKQYDKAGDWFAQAIEINPNVETAYRYWGDSLMAEGKMSDARAKFIDAVVAEPYTKKSNIGIQQWAERNKVGFTVPRIQSPNSIKPNEKGITLTVDPTTLDRNDGSSAWMIADMSHMLWQSEKFKKEYPDEKEYRHSLKEETERLDLVAEALEQMIKDKKVKNLDPNLAMLLKLKESGLVEAYILISAADQGITQDYAAYREQHRDKLRQYLDEIVVPKL